MPLLTGSNSPRFSQYTADQFTGNGSQTTFTLSRTPPTSSSLIVTIDGVKQHSTTYSINPNQIVFSEAPPNGCAIECVAIGSQGASITPSDSSVTTIKIASKNVTSDKLEDNVTVTTSLGIGTAASGVSGEIRAVGNITSAYSDERVKTNIQTITNALEKVKQLSGFTYDLNDLGASMGLQSEGRQIGISAQKAKRVVPETVKLAPFDTVYYDGVEQSKTGENYLTVQYEKLVPLLIEAIKDLDAKIEEIKSIIKE